MKNGIFLTLFIFLGVLATSFAQSLPDYLPKDDLIGWWPFNGNANDESGYNNNGSVIGAITTSDRFGNLNSAYTFTKTSSISTTFKGVGVQRPRSISFWLKLDPNQPNGGIICSYGTNDGTSVFVPFLHAGNYLGIDLGGTFVTYKPAINDNEWHHVVYVYHVSFGTTTPAVRIYLDGTLLTEQQSTLWPDSQFYTGDLFPFVIGDKNSSFIGSLDDFAFYARALTVQEIEEIYTGKINKPCLPDYVPTNGLVGYWPFCGNANDESGNGNDGTVNGAVLVADRNGISNQAYSFDGLDDFIQTSQIKLLPIGNNPRTVSYWVNSNSAQSYMSVLGYGNNNSDFQDFHVWHNWECPGVNINISNAAITYVTGDLGNNWHNFVLVYDSEISGSIENVKIYMNGTLLTTKCAEFRNGELNTGNLFPLSIGKYHAYNQHYFNGKIDDIGIWNRALSAAEIKQLFTGQIEITCNKSYIPSEGLDAYWSFCGNANDESGNGNNGFIEGATLTKDRFGSANNALKFNTTSKISTPYKGVSVQKPRSISFWMQLNPNQPNGGIICSYGTNDGTSVFVPFLQAGNYLGIDLGGTFVTYKPAINDNKWHHVVYVYHVNFGTTTPAVKIYLDGTLLTEQQSTLWPDSQFYTGDLIPFVIGDKNSSFIGNLDDFAFYSRALTVQEIEEIYTGEIKKPCLPDYVPTDGLVGYWPFCGDANDESGNGNDGIVNGATLTTDRFGDENKAYNFDSDHIDISGISLALASDYTISFWAQPSANVDGHTVALELNQGTFCNSNPIVGFWSDNLIYSTCSDIDQNLNMGNFSSIQNQWTNFVVTINSGRSTVFRNGVLVDNKIINWPQIIANKFTIGNAGNNESPAHSQPFKGSLDDIGIWNRALTPEEIEQLYTGEIKKPCLPDYVPTDGLVGYWPFCGNANDESGNGNNGVVSGVTLTTDRFGNPNKAYEWKSNGDIGQYISIGAMASNFTQKSFSFSAWVLADAGQGANPRIINFGNVYPGVWSMGVNNTSRNYSGFWPPTGGFFFSNPVSSLAWNHLVYTTDATTGSTSFYVNGALDTTFCCSSPDPTSSINGIWEFGKMKPTEIWGGKLDDIGIWNRALTEEEILKLYFGTTAITCDKDDILNQSINYGSISDNDGNVYATVKIGQQEWMAENLRATKFQNGVIIPNVTNNNEWRDLDSAAWSYYSNDSLNNCPLGKLYNWYAVSDPNNLCPTGWRIPSKNDFRELSIYLGGDNSSGRLLKNNLWLPPNEGATNSSGFSALPGGLRYFDGQSLSGGGIAFFWTRSSFNTDSTWAYFRSLRHFDDNFVEAVDDKNMGYSVRCIKETISTSPLTLSLDTLTARRGDVVVLPVRVKNFTDILSGQMSLTFDPAIVTLAGVENFGTDSITQASFNLADAASGRLSFLWTQNDNIPISLSDGDTLFAMRFKVLGRNTEFSDVRFATSPLGVEFVDASLNAVDNIVLQNGRINAFSENILSGQLRTETGQGIRSATLAASGGSNASTTSALSGQYTLTLPELTDLKVTPSKANDTVVTNGITIADVIRMQRHILGSVPLESPYKIIAADVNHSGTITGLDVVLVNALILGRLSTYPGGKLWSFVPTSHTFTNPQQPFPYPNYRSYSDFSGAANADFIGMKLGDVDNSYSPSQGRNPSADTVTIYTEDQQVPTGATEVRVPVRVSDFESISGFQFGVQWNPAVLKYKGAEKSADMSAADLGTDHTDSGHLNVAWFHPTGLWTTLSDGTAIMELIFETIGTPGSTSTVGVFDSPTTPVEIIQDDLSSASAVINTGIIALGTPSSAQDADAEGVQVSVYPNPFSDALNIEIQNAAISGSGMLSVYDEAGRQIYREEVRIEKGLTRHATGAGLPAGSYTLRLEDRDGRIIKQQKAIKIR